LNDAVVLIEDERIAACGRNVAVPRATEVIDLGDATLSPGFIDAHTHLSIDPSNSYAQTLFDHFQREAPEQAFYAAPNAQRTLHGGFTTVRDVGVLWGVDFVDVALRNAINKGLVVVPECSLQCTCWAPPAAIAIGPADCATTSLGGSSATRME